MANHAQEAAKLQKQIAGKQAEIRVLRRKLRALSGSQHELDGPYYAETLRHVRLSYSFDSSHSDGPDEFEYTHDVHGVFLDGDETANYLYGRTDVGIRGMNICDIVAPEYRKLIERNIQEVFGKVDETNAFPMRTITATGDVVWVEVTARLEPFEGGLRVRGTASMIDAPGPEYRKFKRAVAGARFGLWDRNLVKDRIWVNAWLRTMIGLEQEDMTFGDLERAIHADDQGRMQRALGDHIDNKTKHYECEYRILNAKEQRYHWVLSRGMVTRNREGKATHISGSMLDITARKEAQSHFERLVDTDQNMVFVKDSDGQFLFINHALGKLYNTTLENARGKTDEYFSATPEQIQKFREHDRMVLDGEEVEMPLLEAVRGADGRERWYRTNKIKFEWDGKPALLGVATEVTDLINERRINRQQQDLLESILKSVPIVIDCKDRDGKYTLANPAFLGFIGCSSFDEVEGRTVHELLPKESADVIAEADRAVLAGDAPGHIEVLVPDKDGGSRVFRIAKIALRENGRGIVRVLSVARDITDEKKRIERTEQQLDQEKDRLTRIVQFANVGIFEADRSGRTTWINRKGLELDALGEQDDPDNWKDNLHDANRGAVLRDWDQFTQECASRTGRDLPSDHCQMEQIFKTRDGGQRVLDMRAQATRSDEGELTGFVGVFKDITDLKKTEHNLQQSLESVSHNTKNAVCALEDILEQLGHRVDSRQLIAAGRTSLKTIEDLARIAHAPVEPRTELEEFDLLETVESFQVVNMAVGVSMPKRARVKIGNNVPRWVYGHRAVLMQVLQNLVANAAKRDDVTQPRIELTRVGNAVADTPEITVLVAVEDDGAGLTDDEYEGVQARLSQPIDQLRAEFSSLVASEHGKGLALCQLWLLAIQSGMKVEKGASGKWNRFDFTIRVTERQANGPDDNRLPSLATHGPVLLVEDDPVWKSILVQRLLNWGVIPLAVCEQGEQAVQFAQNYEFALVLMDVRLSGEIDGYEAARQIHEAAPQPPRLVSISITEDDKQKRDAAGFDDFIKKHQLKNPSDLIRVGFPDHALRARPRPAHLSSEDLVSDWFGRCSKDEATAILTDLLWIWALASAWSIKDSRTQYQVHEWKLKGELHAPAVVKRFEDVESSSEQQTEITRMIVEGVGKLQTAYGIW